MSNNLHVIFGTGPVGMAIMDELVALDLPVRMVNRSGKTAEVLPTRVELISGNVADKSFAIKAAKGATVLYNALNPAYSKWPELFPPLQAGAIAAAEANGAKLVVMDNLYMYGDPHGLPMNEQHPHRAHTKKGKLRAQMAADLLAAHESGRGASGGWPCFGLYRAAGRSLGNGGDLVIKAAIKGKAAQVVGDLDVPHSYTYMPDIGRALVTLATHDDAFGEVWHLPTPKAVSTRRMLELIYAAAGQPLKIQVAPKWLLRIIGLFNPDAGELVEMVYEFEKPFIIDDSKFVKRFGWEATGLETVIRETVAWFKNRSGASS